MNLKKIKDAVRSLTRQDCQALQEMVKEIENYRPAKGWLFQSDKPKELKELCKEGIGKVLGTPLNLGDGMSSLKYPQENWDDKEWHQKLRAVEKYLDRNIKRCGRFQFFTHHQDGALYVNPFFVLKGAPEDPKPYTLPSDKVLGMRTGSFDVIAGPKKEVFKCESPDSVADYTDAGLDNCEFIIYHHDEAKSEGWFYDEPTLEKCFKEAYKLARSYASGRNAECFFLGETLSMKELMPKIKSL